MGWALLKYPPSLRSAKHPTFQRDRIGIALAGEQGLKPNFILRARRVSSPLPQAEMGLVLKKKKAQPTHPKL